MKKLTSDFYLREDVLQIARDLIGKELITNINGTITSGIITETEAYAGVVDRASHAYGGRRTNRTETMYATGGISYVYLCYGIHHLFNVVTNVKDIPHAVLIRNIQPLKGLETILERRRKKKIDKTLSTGPGTMSEALGIKTLHNGFDLTGSTIWIEDAGINVADEVVKITPRIGVDYAGEDAKLPYRFVIEEII
ncbi:MAG: DNA-3-methyladenine glycosylase [Bacteroidota bacterium]